MQFLYTVGFILNASLRRFVQLDFQAIVQCVGYFTIFGFRNKETKTETEQTQPRKNGKGDCDSEVVGLERGEMIENSFCN